MTRAIFTAIYTLTPTHCGTGQASGSVDLPIARESHTGLPILPATGLKGVARDEWKGDAEEQKWLFGPALDVNPDATHAAGALIVLEGRLLAFSLRSLNAPFLYATCPLLLERLERDLRALDLADRLPRGWRIPSLEEGHVRVSDKRLSGRALVVEDLVYDGKQVEPLEGSAGVADLCRALVPSSEKATRDRIAGSIVLMPNDDFLDVVRRATPVQARVKLTPGKTTDKWLDDEGNEHKGNLWYEEVLPPDCLFTVLVTERAQKRSDDGKGSGGRPKRTAVEVFRDHRAKHIHVQIGGNETVGQGRCWWAAHEAHLQGKVG